MADRRRSLVLDANILIRAVMGRRVRQLIKQYSAEVELIAPDTAFLEAEEHLPRLCANLGLALDAAMAVYNKVCEVVQELPPPAYSERETEARARIERRDPDDWEVLACALALDCPIWTEDKDFFGAGVPTWTTDRIEIFLSGKEKPKLEIKTSLEDR